MKSSERTAGHGVLAIIQHPVLPSCPFTFAPPGMAMGLVPMAALFKKAKEDHVERDRTSVPRHLNDQTTDPQGNPPGPANRARQRPPDR